MTDPSPIDPSSMVPAIGKETGKTPSSNAFKSMMQQAPAGGQKPTEMSPIQLAQNQNVVTGTPNHATLLAQASQVQGTLGDLQSHLNTKNLKLSKPQQYLLKSKLGEATDHLRAANTKLGAEPPKAPITHHSASPIQKFLSTLTDGQNQLESAKAKLNSLSQAGETLTPSDFLLAQIKMNQAQQELEFSSVLLSKAVDALKATFNIQL